MVQLTIKKLLFCLVSFFMPTLCMEITQILKDNISLIALRLNKDDIHSIAAHLNFVERHCFKSSCKSLYSSLKDEPLFLSPFNKKGYWTWVDYPASYARLEPMVSPQTILRFKVFAARQKDKDKKLFFDLIKRYPRQHCWDDRCPLRECCAEALVFDVDTFNKDLVSLYKTKWKFNDDGNKHHFDELTRVIALDCKPTFDLLLAQGIDINAIDEHGYTVLHETCKKGWHKWATKKLVDHKQCNINGRTHDLECTPLHEAAMAGFQSNVKILLTCPGIEMRAKNCAGATPLLYAFNYYCDTGMNDAVYKLLHAADPFQDI